MSSKILHVPEIAGYVPEIPGFPGISGFLPQKQGGCARKMSNPPLHSGPKTLRFSYKGGGCAKQQVVYTTNHGSEQFVLHMVKIIVGQ